MTSEPTQLITKTEQVVNRTLERLTALFPAHRITDDFKREYLRAFMDNNIDTIGKVDFGIKRARIESGDGRVYMPTGPMFSTWCKHIGPTYKTILDRLDEGASHALKNPNQLTIAEADMMLKSYKTVMSPDEKKKWHDFIKGKRLEHKGTKDKTVGNSTIKNLMKGL